MFFDLSGSMVVHILEDTMKNQLSNLRMAMKLLVSPVTAALFLVAFAAVTSIGMYRQKVALDDIYNNRIAQLQTSSDIMIGLRDVNGGLNKLVAWLSSNFDKEKTDALAQEQMARLEKVYETLQKGVKSPGLTKTEKAHLQETLDMVTRYKLLVRQCITAGGAAATMTLADSDTFFEKMTKGVRDLIDLQKKLSKDEYQSAKATYYTTIIISIIVFAAALILPFAIGLFIKSLIVAPITKTVEAIEEVSQGDLTKRIDVTSSDEIGEMARHFNGFVEKLHGAITHVAESSDAVSSAASMLDSATEQMAAGVEEAAMQVNSVAAASEEMSKTSSEIAQNCVLAAKSSDEATQSVNVGEAMTQQTITIMTRISDRVKDSAEVIRSLGTRSDQIGQIVGLINDVADQTNLLALNAAIEAARAGEHGRGFAVVADEVRKLAERTSHATKEISNTIYAMQSETKKAVSSMEEGVNEVGTGTSEAAKSGSALQDILRQINKVTGEINQIAVASEQETATTNEIASSIQQISEVMQETARSIQENTNASSQLASLAGSLQTMVRQFKL
jgi:methyl-accepting chemotaxis protein